MSSAGGSFFPRIESVFYTVFDVHQGPKVVYQVPEGLILSGPISSSFANTALHTPTSASSTLSLPDSPSLQRLDSRQILSPRLRPVSANRCLFNFDDISKYVMPPSALCGRLVICATRKYRIIGFPMELRGNYERNYFRYNLCFVFDRNADLSCYEPVVRKVSRVLTTCEEESAFLSSPESSPAIHAILEQLYEDLNSYSETSIAIDMFNSIELKIFPFYPNPPVVKDWMVPLALINLTRRIEPNWDLTMVKVCQFIDGTNHVSRIARLAECDVGLTRQAISHLLYYQVVMMIDIFQYSNMYTLRKSIQWLVDESHVKEECGPYATRPGQVIADWPKLLHLYSRLKPGKTIREWMEDHDVQSLGIDVRRFTSFGVIKGFLRRVHRWPILLSAEADAQQGEKRVTSIGRKRSKSYAPMFQPRAPVALPEPTPRGIRGRLQDVFPTVAAVGAEAMAARWERAGIQPTRRASAAESSLEHLRDRDNPDSHKHPDQTPLFRMRAHSSSVHSLAPPLVSSASAVNASIDSLGGRDLGDGYTRPRRVSHSPSRPVVHQAGPPFPPNLIPLLDGEHHTDELCTLFEVGWPILKQWLILAGGGKGNGDLGRVSIIYR
ncbi:Nitrogen permease regulator 2 homolog [Sparassis crispa]|uniref:Nitrogen permease regulator 2 homolog n=1 Tax=Sparassis crispa TaxID=139825 RepID=A0A401GIT6_9APHY|nr:Nitrogen permease regulator 2 homolog [Sparassis crispa]GBE82089.1 Nitrogen permease regulator 2 homolog [Sparassis crispa]